VGDGNRYLRSTRRDQDLVIKLTMVVAAHHPGAVATSSGRLRFYCGLMASVGPESVRQRGFHGLKNRLTVEIFHTSDVVGTVALPMDDRCPMMTKQAGDVTE